MFSAQSYMYHFWGFLKCRLEYRLFWRSVRLREMDVRISWFDFTHRLLKYSHWGFTRRICSQNFLFMIIRIIQYNHFQSWGRIKEWIGGKQESTLSPRKKFMSHIFSYQKWHWIKAPTIINLGQVPPEGSSSHPKIGSKWLSFFSDYTYSLGSKLTVDSYHSWGQTSTRKISFQDNSLLFHKVFICIQ